MIEPALYQLLTADAGFAAACADRLYPVTLPDPPPAFPAVSYRQISRVQTMLLEGPLGLVQYRMQFDCWGQAFAQARTAAEAIRAALNADAGDAILSCVPDDEHSGYDAQKRAFYVQSDWLIQYAG